MITPKFKINGQVVEGVRNWKGIEVNASFDETSEQEINIDSLELVREARNAINNWFNGGLDGSFPGILEAPTLDIELIEGSTQNIFSGYIDMVEEFNQGAVQNVVKIKKRKGSDWINDRAQGFSFRYLQEIGVIKSSDFVNVPYIINYIPDYTQTALLSISVFVLGKEIYQATKDLSTYIADAIGGLTGPIVSAIKIALQLVYLVSLSFAIFTMIEQIIASLISPKRNHKGILVKTLLNRGAEHIGLSFQSSIFDSYPYSNLVYLPIKDKKGGSSGETGVPSISGPANTYGDLLLMLKEMFAAKINIENDVIKMERWDKFKRRSGFVIPHTLQANENRTFNTEDFKANTLIAFVFDTQDQNTLDNFGGTNFQVIMQPKYFINKDAVLMKNLESVRIPCALATRKDSLTDVEKTIKTLAGIADDLMGLVGNNKNLAGKIEGRIGNMNLSSDLVGTPKLLILNDGKLPTDYRSSFNAKKLWNDFLIINSFISHGGIHNQWEKYNGIKIDFRFEDFVSLIENNECVTEDGKDAKIDKLSWSFDQSTAIIDYRVNEQYTLNLEEKFNEPA